MEDYHVGHQTWAGKGCTGKRRGGAQPAIQHAMTPPPPPPPPTRGARETDVFLK